jgi:vanillate O-demethylase oxygenase-like protein
MAVTDLDETSTSTSLREYRPGAVSLRDTWLPLVHTGRIGRRVVRRQMHGAPVFFWRDADGLHVTEDSPVDREHGRRRAGELTGGSGDYPVVERYGYQWVWYGNPEAASPDLVPSVPHMPIEGMPVRMQGNVLWDCSYELVCENLLDLTHADFLHSALTGDSLSESDVITVDSTSETVTMTRIAEGRPIPKMQKPMVNGATSQDVILVTLVHVRSGVCVLHGDFNPGMSMRMLHPNNPESPTKSRTPVSYNPKYMPTLARNLFPLATHMVGRQDNRALRPQNTSYLRPGVQKDLNSRFDRAAIRYRKVYQDLVVRQAKGDYSYLADGDPQRDVVDELGLNRREEQA